MVRTRDSHSLNRGSIPLTAAINFDYLYCFCFCYGVCSEIEPIITVVIWGSYLSQNVTFSHLLFGRVLTAAINFDYSYCFCFCYGAGSEIEPIITVVIRGSYLSQNVTFSHLLFGRVLTAVYYWHGKNPLRKSNFVAVHVAIPKR